MRRKTLDTVIKANMQASRADEIEEMKKIFFVLLKKWTTDQSLSRNLDQFKYYEKDKDEEELTFENLQDVPAGLKYMQNYKS